MEQYECISDEELRMEANAKHTSGPWKVVPNSVNERSVRAENGFICFTPKPFRYTGQYDRYEEEQLENIANVTLIASAPELLEACKHLVQILDLEGEEFYNSHIEAFNMGIDAINKAEGK